MGTLVLQGHRLFLVQLRAAALRFFRQKKQPFAAAPDRAREASELRQYADSIRKSDPSFAHDLFAAADRHERGGQCYS